MFRERAELGASCRFNHFHLQLLLSLSPWREQRGTATAQPLAGCWGCSSAPEPPKPASPCQEGPSSPSHREPGGHSSSTLELNFVLKQTLHFIAGLIPNKLITMSFNQLDLLRYELLFPVTNIFHVIKTQQKVL